MTHATVIEAAAILCQLHQLQKLSVDMDGSRGEANFVSIPYACVDYRPKTYFFS